VNIYKILKYNKLIKNFRIKSAGIFVLHALGKRYLAIYFDPVLACNLRCQMCYFSDEEIRKTMKGVLPQEHISLLGNAFFHRAIKLQIGCGAEPSLYKHNVEVIKLAKQKGVPYISMTSNGNLLSKDDLQSFFAAGLDELTLSMHGVYRETYEKLMTNANYDKFHEILTAVTALKQQFPNIKLRINYTVNKDNLMELSDLFVLYGKYSIDILQMRPIQQLGDTEYHNFSIEPIIQHYEETIGKVSTICKERKMVCLAPTLKSLIEPNNKNHLVVESTYCYISPKYIWRDDFDLINDTYELYSKRTNLGKLLFYDIFRKKSDYDSDIRNLNYTVS
jgi:molybdenum cofactor biosynthesis enzyme MoaA